MASYKKLFRQCLQNSVQQQVYIIIEFNDGVDGELFPFTKIEKQLKSAVGNKATTFLEGVPNAAESYKIGMLAGGQQVKARLHNSSRLYPATIRHICPTEKIAMPYFQALLKRVNPERAATYNNDARTKRESDAEEEERNGDEDDEFEIEPKNSTRGNDRRASVSEHGRRPQMKGEKSRPSIIDSDPDSSEEKQYESPPPARKSAASKKPMISDSEHESDDVAAAANSSVCSSKKAKILDTSFAAARFEPKSPSADRQKKESWMMKNKDSKHGSRRSIGINGLVWIDKNSYQVVKSKTLVGNYGSIAWANFIRQLIKEMCTTLELSTYVVRGRADRKSKDTTKEMPSELLHAIYCEVEKQQRLKWEEDERNGEWQVHHAQFKIPHINRALCQVFLEARKKIEASNK